MNNWNIAVGMSWLGAICMALIIMGQADISVVITITSLIAAAVGVGGHKAYNGSK